MGQETDLDFAPWHPGIVYYNNMLMCAQSWGGTLSEDTACFNTCKFTCIRDCALPKSRIS